MVNRFDANQRRGTFRYCNIQRIWYTSHGKRPEKREEEKKAVKRPKAHSRYIPNIPNPSLTILVAYLSFPKP